MLRNGDLHPGEQALDGMEDEQESQSPSHHEKGLYAIGMNAKCQIPSCLGLSSPNHDAHILHLPRFLRAAAARA